MDDLIILLKEDHLKILNLLDEILLENNFYEIYPLVEEQINMNIEGEEKILYPELEDFDEIRETILEAYEKNKHCKIIMDELRNIMEDDENLRPKLKLLRELIKKNIHDEEDLIFPAALNFFSENKLSELKKRILNVRENIDDISLEL